MIWHRMVATHALHIIYPEGLRAAMLHFIGRKEFEYPDGVMRKAVIVEVEPFSGKTDAATLQTMREYGERGDRDGVVYVLDGVANVFSLDMPGMRRVDSPWIDVETPGLKIPICCENADIILGRLRDAELKNADGFEFYNVAFFYREIVFGAAERPELLAAFEKILPEARRRAAAYDEKYDKEFPNARANIAKIEAGTHAMGPEGLVELPGRLKPS